MVWGDQPHFFHKSEESSRGDVGFSVFFLRRVLTMDSIPSIGRGMILSLCFSCVSFYHLCLASFLRGCFV
jgi:hypothetical protein